ncbi:MAG: winged helix-turn-helix transcriptional regulator [Kiritimatiellae bacterium]|nr:winged helix-turn-helix transcriptional regulator [Kiritimatiellia bacterium]
MLARMADVLRQLAHPQRLKIVEILNEAGEAPVHEIVERLGLPQAATSQHLGHLKGIGIVEAARRGKEVWYSIADRRSIKILNCIRGKGGVS